MAGEEINEQPIRRVSAGIVMILSALLMFESVTLSGKTALICTQLPGRGDI